MSPIPFLSKCFQEFFLFLYDIVVVFRDDLFFIYLFRDIMPIFQEPVAVKSLTDILAAHIEVHFPDVDVILGIHILSYGCVNL